MNHDPVRRVLQELPPNPVPEKLAAGLRVMASHEWKRRARRHAWTDRWSLRFQNLLKPLALPATGGLLASMLLFAAMVDTLDIRRYLQEDLPRGVYTQVSVDELSPFGGEGGDAIIEVTVDEHGRVVDFNIPNGQVSPRQLRQIGNLILFSTFTPATAYGQPVTGKILVALHHINVKG